MSDPRHAFPVLSRRGFGLLLGAAGLSLRASPGMAAPVAEKTVKVGPSLYELAVSKSQNLLYVASTGPRNSDQAKLFGLDLRTLEVKSTIPLGHEAIFGLAVNDRTGLAYGTNAPVGKLVVVDLRAGSVKAVVTEGEGPHLREVVVDEANNRAFVTAFGIRDKPSGVWIVDTETNKVASVISEGLEGGITGLAYDAKGDRLFTTALQKNEVVEISLAKKAAVRRFASGGDGAVNLAFDPARGRLYCTNQKSGQLAVLDAASGNAVKVIDTGAGALGVALSADGGRAFVANRGAGTVSIVDTKGLAVLASLETGTHPNTVAVDPRSGLAYVSNKNATGQRGAPPPEDPRGDTVSLISG